MTETVGILGAGFAGKAIARFFLTAGRNVVISNSRGPDTLGEVIAELGAGAEAGTTAQAAQPPLVVLATPWTSVEDALAALPSWSGKTLVDATNPIKVFDPPTVELFDLGDRTSSEVVASLAPGASVGRGEVSLSISLRGEAVAGRGVSDRGQAIESQLDGLPAADRDELLSLIERLLRARPRPRDEGDVACRLCDWSLCMPDCPMDHHACGAGEQAAAAPGQAQPSGC